MSPLNILLVDDSKSARYALRLQLQHHGARVDAVESAEAALEKLKDKRPDAVFMDHTMPGMNGFEALEVLKSDPKTSDIPVVMCTTNEDAELIAQAKRKGAAGILSKATAADKLPSLLETLHRALSTPGGSVAKTLNGDSTRAPRGPGHLAEDELDRRLQGLITPLLDGLSERLKAELAAETEQKLKTRFEEEAKRLQQHFIRLQREQAQLTSDRLVNQVLPKIVRQQRVAAEEGIRERRQHEIAEERQQIAKLVQELIDTSVDQLTEQPAFLRRLLQATEATAARDAEYMVRRQAQEVAETVARERAGEVADRLIRSGRTSLRTMYLLAAGAAGVGIAAAAAVYFLVR